MRYLRSILKYILEMAPCMLLALGIFFLLRPYRAHRLADAGLRSERLREFALCGFFLFSTGLGALTLFPHRFWSWENLCILLQGKAVFAPVDLSFQLQRMQWIPLQNILNGGGNPGWGRFLFWGNIIMFLPLGFFPALLWQNSTWYRSLLIGFGSSLSIEVVQFFIGRSTDINDVLLNSFGALCGFWLYCLFRHLAPQLCKRFQCTPIKEAPYGRKAGDPTASA